MLGGGGITNVCIMCLPAHRLRCRWHSEALMCESARRRIETIVENSEESTEQEYERRCLGERERVAGVLPWRLYLYPRSEGRACVQ